MASILFVINDEIKSETGIRPFDEIGETKLFIPGPMMNKMSPHQKTELNMLQKAFEDLYNF